MKNTDAAELGRMVEEVAVIYRTTPEAIHARHGGSTTCAARKSVIHWARQNGYSLPFLAAYFDRDMSTIVQAERSHAATIAPLRFKSSRVG